jgi:hypothetical protein
MKYELTSLMKVDYTEVQDAINKQYGFEDYNLPYAEEANNDSCLLWKITGKLTKHEEDLLVQYKDWASARMYMNDLARLGVIPVGIYLIVISW